ncbi:MAG: hypothetical protein EOP53_14785 [Sphingobacteriales bacterium]|nr:MAG: hypothetical protein EOP53_14785 [Sphingobacteriales bacterium]
MAQYDERVQLARLQKEIQDYLSLPSDNLIFEYSNADGHIKLDLVTVNPRHNQSFLFHSTLGVDKVDALEKMCEYVRGNHHGENNYTVQWTAKDDNQLHTSYFNAKNIYEALDKLYYGRDMNTITVYIVKLNPIS